MSRKAGSAEEFQETFEKYNFMKQTRRSFLSSAEVSLDTLEAKTIGCYHIAHLCAAARWDWNKRILYQAFTGLEHDGRKIEHEKYGLLEPISPLPSEEQVPKVSTSEQVIKFWEAGKIPKQLLQPVIGTGKLGTSAALMRCGLFTVEKTAVLLRLIFDARPANLCFNKADVDPMVLYGLEEFMDALDQFIWRDACFFLSADLRHFYYQLRMPRHYARFMAVAGPQPRTQSPAGGQKQQHESAPRQKRNTPFWQKHADFMPMVMAMGFFPVCTWAQTTTITSILHVKEGDKYLGVAEEQVSTCMPRIIWLYAGRVDVPRGTTPLPPLGEIIGFIAVVMDGFLLVTCNFALRQLWRSRLKECFKYFNGELKLPKTPKPKQGEGNPARLAKTERPAVYQVVKGFDESEAEVVFGGLQIQVRKGWRPDAELTPFPTKKLITRREWASVLGEINWAVRVADDPLVEKEDMMSAYSFLHRGDHEWDAPFEMPRHHVLAIEAEWNVYAEGNYTHRESLLPITKLYAACSDAHVRGTGGILYEVTTSGLRVIEEFSDQHENALDQLLQETDASVTVTIRALAHAKLNGHDFSKGRIGIALGLDADTARFTLEKEYSKSPEIRRYIRQRRKAVPAAMAALRYTRIPGKELIADCPSRGLCVYMVHQNGDDAREVYRRSAHLTPEQVENLDADIASRKKVTERYLEDCVRQRLI